MQPFLIDLCVPLFGLVHFPVFFDLFQNMCDDFWKPILVGVRVGVSECFQVVVQIVGQTGRTEQKRTCDVPLGFEMFYEFGSAVCFTSTS